MEKHLVGDEKNKKLAVETKNNEETFAETNKKQQGLTHKSEDQRSEKLEEVNCKELFTIGKEALKDSYDRRSRIEQRAIQAFPVLSILIGIVVIILKEILQKPVIMTDLMFIVIVAALLMSFVTPILVFKILWVKESERLSLSSLYDRFTRKKASHAYMDTWATLKRLAEEGHNSCNEKAKILRVIHLATILNIIMVTLLIILFLQSISQTTDKIN